MTRALFHGRRYRFAVTVGRSRFRNIYIGGEGGSGNGLITSNGEGVIRGEEIQSVQRKIGYTGKHSNRIGLAASSRSIKFPFITPSLSLLFISPDQRSTCASDAPQRRMLNTDSG